MQREISAFSMGSLLCFFLSFTVFEAHSYAKSIKDICAQSTAEDHLVAGDGNPYQASMGPTQGDRRYGIELQEEQILQILKFVKPSPAVVLSGNKEAIIKEFFDSRSTATPSYPESLPSHIGTLYPKPENLDSEVLAIRILGPNSCPSGDNDCRKAFGKILEWMNPVRGDDQINNGGWITRHDLILALGSDPKYSRGASILARRLIDKYERINSGSLNNPGDLFEDVVSAFHEAGSPLNEAQELAWDYLALYSTRGANMIYRFATAENSQVFASLGLVASIISYLDGASLASGKTYSLPRSVQTTCDYTRPYHFWMAASLARKLAQAGFSLNTAFDAVHAEDYVYELSKAGYLDTKNKNGHFNVETQKNIAFSDAGTAWALLEFTGAVRPVNIDQILRNMYDFSSLNSNEGKPNGSGIISNLFVKAQQEFFTDQEFGLNPSSYYKFNAIIQPDAGVSILKPFLSKSEGH